MIGFHGINNFLDLYKILLDRNAYLVQFFDLSISCRVLGQLGSQFLDLAVKYFLRPLPIVIDVGDLLDQIIVPNIKIICIKKIRQGPYGLSLGKPIQQ